MYSPMVLLPMRDSFLKSESEATPATSEVSTSGTAISGQVHEDIAKWHDPIGELLH